MNKTQELERIDLEISSLVGSIEHQRMQIQKLEKDIALFRTLEISCHENISVLKSKETVAVASEYRRAKSEEITISNRLKSLRIELSNFNIAVSRTEKFLLDAREKRDILIKNQTAPVIKGNFGKDGQK